MKVDIAILNLSERKSKSPFMSRSEIMELTKVKSQTYNTWMKHFRNAISKGIYSKYVLIEPGDIDIVMFRPFLHFLVNYNVLRDEKMIKYVKPYSDSDDYEIGEVMKDFEKGVCV